MIEQPELANGIEMDRTDCCMASAYASFQNQPQQTLGPTKYLLSCFIIIYLGENLTWESIYARYDNDLYNTLISFKGYSQLMQGYTRVVLNLYSKSLKYRNDWVKKRFPPNKKSCQSLIIEIVVQSYLD